MLKKITFIIFLSAFALLAPTSAQTAVAPEKQSAIKELLAVMNADNQFEQLIQVYSVQMNDTRREMFKAIVAERLDLSAAERKSLLDSYEANYGAAYKNFEARLFQKTDFRALMEEMMLATYDKFYTLEELNDLLAFYKTPTGQKTIKLMPVIAADSMSGIQEKLLPKLMNAIKEIEQEDRRDLEQKLEAKKPRAKKRAAK